VAWYSLKVRGHVLCWAQACAQQPGSVASGVGNIHARGPTATPWPPCTQPTNARWMTMSPDVVRPIAVRPIAMHMECTSICPASVVVRTYVGPGAVMANNHQSTMWHGQTGMWGHVNLGIWHINPCPTTTHEKWMRHPTPVRSCEPGTLANAAQRRFCGDSMPLWGVVHGVQGCRLTLNNNRPHDLAASPGIPSQRTHSTASQVTPSPT
jgi:hypothetical protein